MIIDWTGNIITNMSMKSNPWLFKTSMKNDLRFLVAESNQTLLSFTEYIFNSGQIITSKTKNKSLAENGQLK